MRVLFNVSFSFFHPISKKYGFVWCGIEHSWVYRLHSNRTIRTLTMLYGYVKLC